MLSRQAEKGLPPGALLIKQGKRQASLEEAGRHLTWWSLQCPLVAAHVSCRVGLQATWKGCWWVGARGSIMSQEEGDTTTSPDALGI